MTKSSYTAIFGLTREWASLWVLSELQLDCNAQIRALNRFINDISKKSNFGVIQHYSNPSVLGFKHAIFTVSLE